MTRLPFGRALLIFVGFLAAVYFGPVLRWAYPIRYADSIRAAAARYDLDPFLIAAVIRVESGFNPTARSPRGARGLMQLMPDTAGWIAEQKGIQGWDAEMLDRPAVNIDMGAWYLRSLFRQFGDDLHVVLAAYNGGRGNVQQWLAEKDWSGRREEIERIPFVETRRYVQRVIETYEGYRWVYRNRFPEG